MVSLRPSNAAAQAFSNVGHSYSHTLTLLYPTVVLALEKSWGLSYGELIGLMLAGQILFGAAALPAGWLGDRWSALGMMVIFFLGSGAASVLTGFARDPLEVALGLALIGLFASIYHPVGMAWLVRTAVNRGRALGNNGVFGAIGVALGPLVAGVLTDFVSWRAAFIVPGIAAVVTGLAMIAAWQVGWIEDSKIDVRPQAEPSRGNAIRAFFILSLTMLCVGLIGQCYMVMLPKLFAERLADVASGTTGAGLLVTLAYLLASSGQYISGRLSDRMPLKHIYVGVFALQAPILLLASVLDSWPLLLVSVAMLALNIGSLPAENGLLALYTPAKWRATAYGAKFVLALGVSALAIPLIGYIHDTTGGFFWLFMVLAALAATVLVAGLWLPAERRQDAIAAEPAIVPAVAAE